MTLYQGYDQGQGLETKAKAKSFVIKAKVKVKAKVKTKAKATALCSRGGSRTRPSIRGHITAIERLHARTPRTFQQTCDELYNDYERTELL